MCPPGLRQARTDLASLQCQSGNIPDLACTLEATAIVDSVTHSI